MNRRVFLRTSSRLLTSVIASTAAVDVLAQRARADGCRGPAAGVQLFTIREALGRDLRGALRSLRDIGIVEAELFGLNGPESSTLFGQPVGELKRAFDEHGIRLPISHVGGDLTNTGAIADIART